MAKHKANAIWSMVSFKDAIAEAKKTTFRDGSAGVILARSLEHISSEIYEQRGVDENFLSFGIHINNEGGYSDIITSLKARVEGDFKQSGTSDNTKGTITISGEASSLNVTQKEANSNWTFVEVEQAKMQGYNNISRVMMGHNSRYMTEIDDAGILGIGGVDGLVNHSDATVLTASKPWSTMTNVELTDEISAFIINQRSGKSSAFKCDKVAISDELMLKIQSSNADDGVDKTIKDKIESAYGVEFVESSKLQNTSTTGNLSRMVAFSTNREAVVFRIPVPLTISNIYQSGDWRYNFDSFFRIAGLDVLEKDVIYILDEF